MKEGNRVLKEPMSTRKDETVSQVLEVEEVECRGLATDVAYGLSLVAGETQVPGLEQPTLEAYLAEVERLQAQADPDDVAAFWFTLVVNLKAQILHRETASLRLEA